MRFYLLYTISLIASSCSTLEPLTYKDIQWDGTSSAKILEEDKFDINSDIEFLKYSLKKAYIGSDFIDKKIWNRFLRRIDVIKKKKY